MPDPRLNLPRRPALRAAALGLAAAGGLLAAAPLRADVDAEILPGDRVSASLDPASETETFRLDLPRGASLSATIRGARKGPPVHTEVRRPDTSGAATGTDRGTGSNVSRVPVTESGRWALAVTSRDGVTPGDYTLRTKVSFARGGRFEAFDVPNGGEGSAEFSAAAGSVVRFSTTLAGDDATAPRLLTLTGPDGFSLTLNGAASQAGVRIPATGDYTVTFTHASAAAVVVRGRITIAPPRLKPRKIDLRSSTIGAASTEETAVAEVVTPDGGLVEVGDLGLGGGLDDISGASVAIPSGALALPTSIVIATAPELSVAGSAGGLGATVFFGPEGLTFGTKASPVAVTITIPVDLAAVGNDRNLVDVYVRDSKGRVTRVPGPYDFDSAPGYVSFPSTHFSSYRAVAASIPALNPFTIVTVTGATEIAPATPALGNDARALIVDASTTTIRLLADQPSAPPTADVFAGGGTLTADGTDRLQFDFQATPTAVFADANGNVYVGTATRLFRINASGSVTRIAGTGIAGDGGDNGPATAAQFSSCSAILVDAIGNVFLADPVNGRVRLIQSVGGQIVTEFGTGSPAFGADGSPASTTTLLEPNALAFRPGGGLYVADRGRIRALNRGDGTNVTVAGSPSGNLGSTDHATDATSALFTSIVSLFSDGPNGAIFAADSGSHAIRKVTLSPGSSVETVVGTLGSSGTSNDGATVPFPILNPAGAFPASVGSILFLEGDGRVRVYTLP